MRLQWESGKVVPVEGTAALDCVLDNLTAATPREEPIIVDLIHPVGGVLSMGIGLETSVLSHVPASNHPPYHASVGDLQAVGTVVFYYGGHWSEFPRRHCIPLTDARQVMREFLATGELPSWLDWEEV